MTTLDNIKKLVKKGCKGIACEECPIQTLCHVITPTSEAGSTVAQELLNLLSYDSDLSKCKVGDWVWEQKSASWVRIIAINSYRVYPIEVPSGTYTMSGQFYDSDKLPTLFVEPPLCFNPESKPESVCNFKEGD